MYWGDKKIGYTHSHIAPATYQGRPVHSENSHSVMKLTMLGAEVEQDEAETSLSDLNYRPLSQTVEVKSNGSALHIEAVYDYAHHRIDCTIGSGKDASHKAVPIPPGVNLAADPNLLTAGRKLAVGQKIAFSYLEPITITLEAGNLEVTGRETIKDNLGKSVNAYIVKTTLPMGEITEWTTSDGEMIRGRMVMGPVTLNLAKESKQTALDMHSVATADSTSDRDAAPPGDFADATAINPDKPIVDPRHAQHLTVAVSGIPASEPLLSDQRQQETRDSANNTVLVTLTAEPFDPAQAAQLPVQDPALTPYLERAPYLETTDPEIERQALRLRGGEKDLYRIACSIRDWVSLHMSPDASIGVPRSATDIFHRRKGVCRDYATLYTTLARAAGVPTRLCGGIVYAQHKFFYHAWAESYVGQWFAFDPTLYDSDHPIDYVDATHIKFAQGDVTQMFDVVNRIGKLHIHIEE